MKSEKREEELTSSLSLLLLLLSRSRPSASLPHDIEIGFRFVFFLFQPQALFLSLDSTCFVKEASRERDQRAIREEANRIETPSREKRKKTESRSSFFLLATAAAPRWQAPLFALSLGAPCPSPPANDLSSCFRSASSSLDLSALLARGEAQGVLSCSIAGATPRPRPSAPGGGRAHGAASTQP